MGKQDEVVMKEAPAPVASEAPARVSLEEFCTRLSTQDKRVEMIGAFAHVERVAKRYFDTDAAYSARYTAFCTAPA